MVENYNEDKEKAIQILNYWFLMEFLQQQSIRYYREKGKKALNYKKDLKAGKIKEPKEVVDNFIQFKPGDNLQTLIMTASEEMEMHLWSDFTIFIGCIKKETCIRNIAQNIEWNGQSPDKNDDEIALASLTITKSGNYVAKSLSISPIVWAMKKLSGKIDDVGQILSVNKYNFENKAIEERVEKLFKPEESADSSIDIKDIFPVSKLVSYELLKKIENIISGELGVKECDIQSYITVSFKLYASEENAEKDDDKHGLHMDFYSEDLAFVKEGLKNNIFTKEKENILLDYILGLDRYVNKSGNVPNRFNVIRPENEEELYQFMIGNLTAAKAPLGKWPSRFMPALMQQIAINLAIDEDNKLPIFSVNGPPGTGKTTLLKEIIVNNLVEKARLLAEYKDPDDAFYDYSFSNGKGPDKSYNQYVRKYHRLKNKQIKAYSVLVVSSNNTAVENITKELPVEEKILDDLKPSQEIEQTNNIALANMSKLFTVAKSEEKLPFIKKTKSNCISKNGKEYTRCYETAEVHPDIYFSKFATNLLNDGKGKSEKQQAFGLISAALGKKPNIEKVEENVIEPLLDIMRKNDDITIRKQNYLNARDRFVNQLKLVQNLCIKADEISNKENEVSELRRKVEEKKRLSEEYQKKQFVQLPKVNNEIQIRHQRIKQFNESKYKLELDITSSHSVCTNLKESIKIQQKELDSIHEKIQSLENNVPVFSKFFKTSKFRVMQEAVKQASDKQALYMQLIENLNENLKEEKNKEAEKQKEMNNLQKVIHNENRKLIELCDRRNFIISEGQRIESELSAAEEKLEEQSKQVEKVRNNYHNQESYEKGFVLDRQFVKDVLSSDKEISTKAQLRNPWFSEHYNREREKLFFYALQMTKEFILSSKKCRDNLKHLHCLWTGSYDGSCDKKENVKFVGDDLQNVTAAAYETLFMLIPVVSSTFASVQSLFKNVKEENIVGTLIVDEAGQACPHMAIGALYRSGKAIIVGDPKQVEPVVTDEQDLLKQTFTDELFIPYKDKTNSVQRFADVINPYGTYLKNTKGDAEWVGCPLLVHRRCISPMYEISNDISYGNIMKQQTAQPNTDKQKMFISEKSQWFNIRGKEEGISRHFVKEQGEKVIKMLEVAFFKNSKPDIFVISPFTTVVSGIKEYLKRYVEDCKRNGVNSSLKEHESSLLSWLDKNVGTVHKFQGKEAAEVIFLLGCDTSKDAEHAIKWVNNNIVNVAATRAKYRFYVIGDIEAWKKSKCVSSAKKILDSFVSGSLGWVPRNHNPDGGYTLVITEKPSVAEAYAKALCVWNEPTNDYYEGNGYLISWCLGHLVELAMPDVYNKKYKNWDINDLPIIPDVWKYQIMTSNDPNENNRIMKRFASLKTLMNRDDVTTIFCATDAGREGELIFRLVYQQADCKKPFKRIWLSSMEPDSIRKAFDNPDAGANYDSLYEAARCRQLADWLVGINASRFYTCHYRNKVKKLGKNVLSVGRVVSPTMAMIVEKEKEIESFVPETYYTVNLNVGGVIFESKRFQNKDEAIKIEKNCKEAISNYS